ncbi:PLP-dependent aminotransferase family protein [Micromonospora endolithica]|uniref:PLP-dependent aminotransferase family protein n=1 Tax=Micromonospora endolithica TaxID=230091 RepID=A0A3A9YZL9_9ACTN|nr:PLP-dependent aminotransferase family protein [Micromonospora endolithica]RKN40617.1 PLP-dependent aminotransferase family protein [Micromonospora endolithica]TWJ21701.1 (S)-3,5-dihydroxyphenylglycine transaminase [Micromonospora endolithica]
MTPDLRLTDLHPALDDPALTSMNFLNEVAQRYPDAVSLAAGRPYEEFFDVATLHRHLDRFRRHLAEDLGQSPTQVHRTLFQYGRTKGIVHHLVTRNLAVDEGITVDDEAVVVTVGCQEAMFLVLRALRATPRDVLLAVAPTYVGLTGAARLLDLPVRPVAGGPAGVDLADLRVQVHRARAEGLRPRACYVMPDFANPSGASIDVAGRRRLLDLAAEEDLLLLEDNPYGLFPAGDGDRPPTLKALDTARRVVYLGSFAKTVLPGARVGYVVADQRVGAPDGTVGLLADQLAKIKSMVTVNTSALAQAVVGGALLEHGCSLVAATVRERAAYTRNLRHLVAGLARRFGDAGPVRWNVPAGGFFVVVTVPFGVDDALLDRSAREYGVLWTPMAHFYDDGAPVDALRLSVSAVTPAEIDRGLDRLAALVADELTRRVGTAVR